MRRSVESGRAVLWSPGVEPGWTAGEARQHGLLSQPRPGSGVRVRGNTGGSVWKRERERERFVTIEITVQCRPEKYKNCVESKKKKKKSLKIKGEKHKVI